MKRPFFRWPFKWPHVKVVPGCDGDPYLTRVTLFRTPWGSLKLHYFHRGDEDKDLHDHPWPFVSIILKGGYIEETPVGHHPLKGYVELVKREGRTVFHEVIRPGRILRRPAQWVHGVRLLNGPALTLVWMGNPCREWGFHTSTGWMHWRDYIGSKNCVD